MKTAAHQQLGYKIWLVGCEHFDGEWKPLEDGKPGKTIVLILDG